MRSLQDVRLYELMPAVLANTPHAKGLAAAMALIQAYTVQQVQATQFYTGLEQLPECSLDALAKSLNVQWYDFSFDVSTKRRVLQTAISVRKYAGTPYAVRQQLAGIFGDAELEEWQDWGGEPGQYRVSVNITDAAVTVMEPAELERIIQPVGRVSAQLESLGYMVRKSLRIGAKITARQAGLPLCGTLRCGSWPQSATVGGMLKKTMATVGQLGAFAYQQKDCGQMVAGTVPEQATMPLSVNRALLVGHGVKAFCAEQKMCGETPVKATLGAGKTATVWMQHHVNSLAYIQPVCGTIPVDATEGEAIQKQMQQAIQLTVYTVEKRRTGIARCGQ